MLWLLTKEYQEHSHHNLQGERQADEDDQGHIEGEGGPLLHDSFELGGIGHQQGDVQHALGSALLVGVVVDVDGSAPLEPLPRSALQPAQRKRVIHTSSLLLRETSPGPSKDSSDHIAEPQQY